MTAALLLTFSLCEVLFRLEPALLLGICSHLHYTEIQSLNHNLRYNSAIYVSDIRRTAKEVGS